MNTRSALEDVLGLAPLQEGFLFRAQYAGESPAVYNVQLAMRIEGTVDPAVLDLALEALLRRHANLRAGFRTRRDGTPIQVVHRQTPLPLREADLSGAEEAGRDAALEELLAAERTTAFDLTRPPLLRLMLVRLGPGRSCLALTTHHIILDGWSAPLLLDELFTLYRAGGDAAGLPPVTPYRDYLAWLGRQDRAAAENAWEKALSGLEEPTLVATGEMRASALPGSVRHEFSAGLTGRLEAVARAHRLTMSTLVQGAWAVVLAQLTGRDDVVFGTTVSTRPADVPGAEAMIGLLINTVPVRHRLDRNVPLLTELARFQREQSDLLPHQYLGLARIQQLAGLGELFDTTTVYENYPLDETTGTDEEPGGLRLTEVEGRDATHYALNLVAARAGGQLTLRLDHRVDEPGDERLGERVDTSDGPVGTAVATRILDRVRRLLESVLDRPDVPLGDIDLMSRAERERVLTAGDGGGPASGEASTLTEMLHQQAARTPQAIAVLDGTTTLTYAELHARADRLAQVLIRHGAGPECRIALAVGRCAAMVVGALAVLKTGAAYLPIDPALPPGRIALILDDARAQLLVTAGGASAPPGIVTIDLDDAAIAAALTDPEPAEELVGDRPLPLRPGHVAYALYTSGSTGQPKGVLVEHSSIVSHLRTLQETVPLRPTDRMLARTALGFDASVWEIWLPLVSGAALYVASTEDMRDAARLLARIRGHRITVAQFVPTVLAVMMDAVADSGDDEPHSLEMIFVGGEPLSRDLAQKVAEVWGVSVHNLYGPTETTVQVAVHRFDPADGVAQVPIGQPVANTCLYVLDPRMRPLPVGAPGELYVGGAQVSRGYLGQPAQTAARFVADPFDPAGARLYRTGDLARWRADGVLEYLGRTDDQVKIRGMRIETGEIEAVLTAHPLVRTAVVVVRETGTGDRRLVAYVVPADVPAGGLTGGRPIDLRPLRDAAAAALPAHMVPSAFVPLAELPLTGSGKLDKRALPVPELAAGGVDGVDRTRRDHDPREEIVAGLFAEVLGLEQVGTRDDFFSLGGHSLLAMRLISRVRTVLAAEPSVRDLFETRTAAGLCARLDVAARVRPPLTAAPRPECLPLSFAQRRLWFIDRLEGPNPTYNVPMLVRLTGELNIPALRVALADLTARHESLRTVFPESEGVPYQWVLDPALDAARPVLEDVAVTAGELDDAVARAVGHPFDLTSEIPLRATVFTLAPGDQVLLLLAHHIVSDGASLGPLATDLSAAYTARRDGRAPAWTPLPVQYADYTLWQRTALGDESDPDSPISRQIEHWTTALAGLPDRIVLPTDRLPGQHVQNSTPGAGREGAQIGFTWDQDLHDGIVTLARARQVSVFMVVQAAIATLLSRMGGGTDIPLGSPIAGRPDEALEGLIGFFANTLVLRTDTSGDPAFTDLLTRVREADLSAYAHADLPFERLVEIVNPVRTLTHHPLFQVILTFNHDESALELAGLDLREQPLGVSTAKFDLSFAIEERFDDGRPAGVRGSVEFATDLFDEGTALALAARLERLLRAVTADPGLRIGDLDLLLDDERRQVITGWNDTAHPFTVATLPDLFEAQVRAVPTAPAVRHGDVVLDYAELNARANRLAHHLIAQGAGPERLVAISLPRSVELVVAVLAVLKTGAAYVPIDPDHPAQRQALVLADSAPVLLIDGSSSLDVAHQPDTDPADADRRAPLLPSHPAYVIYTSGSTGRPKGVVVEHYSVNAYLAWARAAYPSLAGRALVHSPFSFDLTITGLFGPLTAGGCCHLADLAPGSAENLDPLLGPPTFVKGTPSHLSLLTSLPATYSPTTHLVLGGEALLSQPLQDWRHHHPRTTVINEYGPTETTVGCTFHEIPPHQTPAPGVITIGHPIWNTRAYVLDTRLQPAPIGVTGELYIAGDLLTRGYLGHPSLTASRYIANPHTPHQRMYRTGDLTRRRPDGRLEFAGRTDHQIKIRGYRIEPGDIETALTTHPAITHATITIREDHPGDQRIIAYIITTTEVDTSELRHTLAATLPAYMIPATIIPLPALPLTPNGKIDHDALPPPAWTTPHHHNHPPHNPLEHTLLNIFTHTLGIDTASTTDNFFDLGGHSLLAIRLTTRINTTLNTHLTIRDLFENPTITTLAHHLTTTTNDDATDTSAGPRSQLPERPERPPLSLAQQRLWFIDRLEGPGPAYNLPLALTLTGQLDVEVLRAALTDLVGRHESLRTVFPEHDGEPYQRILPVGTEPVVTLVDAVPPGALDELLATAARHAFDLAAEIPFRVWIYRAGPGHHTLLLLSHHIAGDGASNGPLLRDLTQAYTDRLAGLAPRWTPLPLQYADHALRQRAALGDETDSASVISAQISHWRGVLAGLPEQLNLPTDRPRPVIASHRGSVHPFSWDAGLHIAVATFARTNRASVFMVLQAAVAALLTRLGAGDDIPIGTPVAGRADEGLDDLVGFFVNTLVLRTDTSSDPTFTELVARVRDTDLAAFAHADVPFDRLVDVVNPTRSLAVNPLFQVVVALDDSGPGDGGDPDLPGLTVTGEGVASGRSKVDLAFDFEQEHDQDGAPAGLRGGIEFALDLFDPATAVLLAERLERLLRAAVARPEHRIGSLELLSGPERDQLLNGWNDTARPVPAATFPALFETCVAAAPQAPALECGSVMLTYAELNARANRLARRLAGLGAGPERTVALLLPRSVDLFVAVVAVLKTGAAYVPIDPDHPADRIAVMLSDAEPVLILDETRLSQTLPELPSGPETSCGADNLTDADRTTALRPAHPAYVIYTSGSTGRPKGVVVTHRGLANLSAHQRQELGAGPGSRVSQLVSPTFDVSVAELCMALLSGGCLVLPTSQPLHEELGAFLAGERISHAHIPPAVLSGLPRRELPALRSLMVGAEPCPPDVTAFWSAGRRMVNAYGPTEATVDVCFAVCDPEHGPGPTPIGRPIVNTRLYVLDDALRPVPAGVTGELYIVAPGLARGYLHRPGLTASRFVADPFVKTTGLMYRTGDLARRRADGRLDFCGRADQQVKVRGLRIELGEIENVLARDPSVGQAVAIVREDRPGDERIAAYVTPAPGVPADRPDPASLRAHTASVLPSYMVPSSFTVLEVLPLTRTGKIDRAVLPAPALPGEASYLPPRDDAERRLCEAFAMVLRVDRVGVEDNFFELGGHSLLAIRLMTMLDTGAALTVRDLFVSPTVAGLRAILGDSRLDESKLGDVPVPLGLEVMLAISPAGDQTPLFCAPPTVPLSWCYSGLPAQLPDGYPVYGLQDRSIGEDVPAPATFAAMIAGYLAEIRRVRPHGPYRFLGYSLGGNIAHALAIALRAAGETVDLLAVLDAYPGGDPDPGPLDAEVVLSRLRADLIGAGHGGEHGGLDGEPATGDREAVLKALRPGLPNELSPGQSSRLLDAMIAAVVNTSQHVPGVFDGDLLLFTTTAGRADPGAMPEAWRAVVSGLVATHPIDSAHDELLEPGPLGDVGRILSERLAELDG